MSKYLWQQYETFGTKDILAAAGSVIATWNYCEIIMLALLSQFIRNPVGLGAKIHALVGNATRAELLLHCSQTFPNEDARDRISEFVARYKICLQNRNLIAHALYQRDFEIEGYVLKKFKKGDGETLNTFAASDDEMLEIANDCYITAQFGLKIIGWMALQPTAPLDGFPTWLNPLPDKLQMPRTLQPRAP